MFIPVNLRYTSNHLWLRAVGKQDAYIGITVVVQKEFGQIESIEIECKGKEQKMGDSFGVIYGANKCEKLIMPFAGQILIVNPDIEKHPGILNVDPYSHWIALLTAIPNLTDNMQKCFTSQNYQHAIGHLKNI